MVIPRHYLVPFDRCATNAMRVIVLHCQTGILFLTSWNLTVSLVILNLNVLTYCTDAATQPFLKKKKKGMQFTKLFKVKFSMVLVKGVRLASVKLSPLFSLRIVNYMYLTHAATTTTTLITTTTTTTKATRRERCAQIQEKLLKTNSTVTCPQPTRHSIKLSKI